MMIRTPTTDSDLTSINITDEQRFIDAINYNIEKKLSRYFLSLIIFLFLQSVSEKLIDKFL